MTEKRNSPLAALSELSRRALVLLALTATAKALALIGLASALASGVVSVIEGTGEWQDAVALGIASALLRAAASWAGTVVSSRAMLGTKERMRGQLVDRLVGDGGGSVGSGAILATRGLDELDNFFTVFLPALVTAATVPLLVGARILFADWVSALIIVLTVPLIPVFMVLIGMHTQDGVAEANTKLARLSDHLVELARGLPVLVGLGRAREQADALRRLSDDHRQTTLATLRIAFLSSLALELIATISVAVVAVFIGVRLVNGDMPLEVGLFALLLAPECFTALREVGAAYHSAQDGNDALTRVRAALTAPHRRALARDAGEAGDDLRVQGLRVRYAGRTNNAVGPLNFSVRPRGVTLIDGPSGAGKSTVLAALAGVLRPDEETIIEGTLTAIDATRVAWLPQHPHTVADSVEDELALYAGEVPDAAGRVSDAIARLGLGAVAAAAPSSLSPGELRRLAMGRVLLRGLDTADILLLDEPTAHLDAQSAERVLEVIEVLSLSSAVIVASHDPAVRSLAGDVISLGEAASASAAEREAASAVAPTRRTPPAELPEGSALRGLIELFRPVAGRTIAAIVLGVLSAAFAVGLTAVSAWLIVRASEQPPIMYLLVAIVGVRFFGIGRAVLRYCERLVGHDAVFGALTELRHRLWKGLASEGAARRALVTGSSVLERLVRDVDRVRELSIRVVLPIAVGLTTMLVAIAVVAVIHAPAVPLFAALTLIVLVAAPAVALLADGASTRANEELRSRVLRRLAALLSASDELRANTVDGRVRQELATLDRRATSAALRGAWAQGLGAAIIVAACCGVAVLTLPLSAGSDLEPGLVAVLALVPLGLIDPVLELLGGVRHAPALRALLRRASGLAVADEGDSPIATLVPARSLELDGVTARWPTSDADVFAPVTASVSTGEWLVITGPSGAGKSTLLTTLLGGLPVAGGRVLVGGRDAAALSASELRQHMAWCPQEGHLFDSTVRANLLIARGRDTAPDDAELLDALRLVGLGPLVSRLSDGLDTRIGPAGARLSGGERQRLAVARTLLTRREIILLDEPTAHLDEEGAAALMADLRNALRERITVLVTHHANDLLPSDRIVRLGQADAARAPSVNVGAPA